MSEVVGNNTCAETPWQAVWLVPNPKVGVSFWVTITVNELVVAHCPIFGVKV